MPRRRGAVFNKPVPPNYRSATALPPLRERREDIPLLVDHLLRRLCDRLSRPVPKFEPELMRFLERFDWPGNVRQLRNCLANMVAVGGDDLLTLDLLPADLDDPAQAPTGMYFPSGTTLAELERSAVEQALAHCGGNRTRAADHSWDSPVRTLQRQAQTLEYGRPGTRRSLFPRFPPRVVSLTAVLRRPQRVELIAAKEKPQRIAIPSLPKKVPTAGEPAVQKRLVATQPAAPTHDRAHRGDFPMIGPPPGRG